MTLQFTLSGESNDFTWTVVRTFTNAKGENQTCKKVDNVTVHDRTPNPTASTGLTTCDGTKQLNASVKEPLYEAGYWTKNENDCKFSGIDGNTANTNIVTVTGIADATTVTLKWNVKSTRSTLTNCVASTPVTITNYNYKPTAWSNDMTFCGVPDSKTSISIYGSLPNGNVTYEGAWTSTSTATITHTDKSTTTATVEFDGNNGGKHEFVWTVTPKEASACEDNSASVIITNMYPGAPTISAVDEVVCKDEGQTITLTGSTPTDDDVIGTWSSTTTASVITDANKNNSSLTIVPGQGFNQFTWTYERTGNTYSNCILSDTKTFDNLFVKAEVDSKVFEIINIIMKVCRVFHFT